MEASAVLLEDDTREFVMAHIWDQAVDHFVAGDYVRAQASFGLFETIEAMSDEEYFLACHCKKHQCNCQDM